MARGRKKGFVMTPEQRKTISDTMKGQKKSVEHIEAVQRAKNKTRQARTLLGVRLKALLQILEDRVQDDSTLLQPLIGEVGFLLRESRL